MAFKDPAREPFRCKKCGDLENLKYAEEIALDLHNKQTCYVCDFWIRSIETKDDPNVVIIKGKQFYVGNENDTQYVRGHGGAKFRIKFHAGREVLTTNLWHQGDIPSRFLDDLPDNAVFLSTGDRTPIL